MRGNKALGEADGADVSITDLWNLPLTPADQATRNAVYSPLFASKPAAAAATAANGFEQFYAEHKDALILLAAALGTLAVLKAMQK